MSWLFANVRSFVSACEQRGPRRSNLMHDKLLRLSSGSVLACGQATASGHPITSACEQRVQRRWRPTLTLSLKLREVALAGALAIASVRSMALMASTKCSGAQAHCMVDAVAQAGQRQRFVACVWAIASVHSIASAGA